MKTIIAVIFLVFTIVIGMSMIDQHFQTPNTNSSIIVNESSSTSSSEEIQEQVKVILTGEVIKPGTYTIEKGLYLEEAIQLAGGITSNADSSCFNYFYVILEDISLYEMHIFKYSIRKGTRAAAMKGQLTEAMKTKRSAVLLEMEARKSKEYRGQFVGQTVSVLLEEEKEIQGSKYMIGHTREYVKVAVPMMESADGKNLTNKIVDVEVKEFLGDDILLGK